MTVFWRGGRIVAAALLFVLALVAWSRSRLPALAAFASSRLPSEFLQGPTFLSAAAGGGHSVGSYSRGQVGAFKRGGGLVPVNGFDVRAFPPSGETVVLSRVDPGFSWLLACAGAAGLPLSLAGVARFQTAVDLACLLLVHILVWRLAGPLSAGAAALLYGRSSATVATPFLVAYYFWSIPLALLVALLGITSIRAGSPRRRGMALVAFALLAAGAVWLRVGWLPVLVLLVPFLSVSSGRWRVAAVASVLAALCLSYTALVARANGTEGDGVLHPRAQLWHTLYLGLGAYGTWGEIRWLDEYAYGVASKAGISPSDTVRYDEYFRGLFLEEVRAHPVWYARLVAQRAADYSGELITRVPGVAKERRTAAGAFVLAVAVALASLTREGAIRWVSVSFLAQVAVWSLLVPPVVPYAIECVGLQAPVVVLGLALGLDALASRFRRNPEVRGSSGGSR